ncbi:MAG: pyridoxamine 5'-phosphate oxidase family protein [Candidatus Micrarchaeales archaeon]|nr:pyridoxamine 5'-phosphate oxidase family protein [Candidatus Micrarchaeales archaeon]
MAKLKELVRKCMESTYYCTIATSENGSAWASPVAFAYDKDFNLYFVSSTSSRHMKNIARNSRIAVAIYTTVQKVAGPKIGVQLEGRVEIVKGTLNILKAYKTYFGRLVKWDGATLKYFRSRNPEWKFFKVNTARLFYFNNGLFGEERQRVK